MAPRRSTPGTRPRPAAPREPRPVDHLQPRAMGGLRVWVRLLRQNGGVDADFRRRAAFVWAASAATAPLRVTERALSGRRARRVDVAAPVFVIGHWRSGTTLLHNLLCADPAFGHVTTHQAIAPGMVLATGPLVRPLLAALMPPTRMADGVPLHLDGPQEEEMALANASEHAYYHHWSFPRATRAYFDRYVLFSGATPAQIAGWSAAYLDLLRRATLVCGGRRLVLKNPPNTARIPRLLELFPEARFVHIHRDPLEVFASTRRFFDAVYAVSALQRLAAGQIEEDILYVYRALLQRFLADRAALGAGRLVDVSYRRLVAAPLETVEGIYRDLGLPGWSAARGAVAACAAAAGGHRQGSPVVPQDMVRRIARDWAFAFDALGYPSPV